MSDFTIQSEQRSILRDLDAAVNKLQGVKDARVLTRDQRFRLRELHGKVNSAVHQFHEDWRNNVG
jgi:hypothetical protein